MESVAFERARLASRPLASVTGATPRHPPISTRSRTDSGEVERFAVGCEAVPLLRWIGTKHLAQRVDDVARGLRAGIIPAVAAPAFDLQSHSTYSDGALAPEDVVRLAAEAGVELLALSDHDTVDGVEAALAAGAELGVRVIPASEISSVDGRYEDLHVLGYGIDHRDAELRERLRGFRADRELRAERMADRLRELGWAVDETRLEERRRAGRTIGRPHLTLAVLEHPDNADRLAAEGVASVSSFLSAYLIPGAPAFLPRTTPTVEEAIDVIHAAGGLAVWAHPFWDIDDPDEVVDALERFRAFGLDGVEAFYVTHTREHTLLLAEECEEHGLLATGSADFHGPAHERFSRFRAFELHGCEPRLGPLAID